MTVRHYAPTTIQIVLPDGTLVGLMLRVGGQWFGPYASVGGARLV